MDVISKRKTYLSISASLVVLSLILILVLGLRPGVDLAGGTNWQIELAAEVSPRAAEVRSALVGVEGKQNISVRKVSDAGYLIRMPVISEEDKDDYLAALREFGKVEEQSFSVIGPAVGAELRTKSIWAVILVSLGISLYVTWAFRKTSVIVSSWKYGLATLATLFHDVAIPTGVLAVLGALRGVEIDVIFIVAILFVMGFSVNDTIVVFDRVRENILLRQGKRVILRDVINESVNQTLVRSVNTSLTLIFMLIALMFAGPASLFYFILTIAVGTVVGTYSSIFVAAPLLYLWAGKI